MKKPKEIAGLIFNRPDDFEPIVRAIHLPEIEFLEWAFSTDKNLGQCYWVMGFIGIIFEVSEQKALQSLFKITRENKEEILKSYNEKFSFAKS